MLLKIEMVQSAERLTVQDMLRYETMDFKKLIGFAEQHGFDNLNQMLQQTLPYVADVNYGSESYAFTHGANHEILVWNCKTGEPLGALKYRTPEQAVNFVKTFDQTNIVTEKALVEFMGSMNHDHSPFQEPNELVMGMER